MSKVYNKTLDTNSNLLNSSILYGSMSSEQFKKTLCYILNGMDNLPTRHRFQIRTFLTIILAVSILAILVSSTTAIATKSSGYIAPYDWIGRLFGGGLIGSIISFLLLLNLDRNIGRAMNKDGQFYTHTPSTSRKVIARVIWIVIGIFVLWAAGIIVLLAAGGSG